MSSNEDIYELVEWYVDEAAKLTPFGDKEPLSFVVARKNALKKWTAKAISRILGEKSVALSTLRPRITKILGDLSDTYVEEYYSFIEKILSRKMRAAIDEYVDDIRYVLPWINPSQIEGRVLERRGYLWKTFRKSSGQNPRWNPRTTLYKSFYCRVCMEERYYEYRSSDLRVLCFVF